MKGKFKELYQLLKKIIKKDINQLDKKKYISSYLKNTIFTDYPKLWNQSSYIYHDEYLELIYFLEKYEYYFANSIQEICSSAPQIDISQISGIHDSHSPLKDFNSFHEFSLYLSPEGNINGYNRFITEEDFINNCRNMDELWNNTSKLKLLQQEWDKRIFVYNADGAHRLAAIYRQCREQNKKYTLPAKKIEFISINKEIVRHIINDFWLVFSDRENISNLYGQYCQLFPHDKKEDIAKFDVSHRKNYNLKKSYILYLKKSETFNNHVAEILSKHKNFLVLNNEIENYYLK
ncbi:hypothetical protein SAMN05660742_10280 [Propionispira arboris]|uniref:Uncharacterized protein n=2 Tax=Propionispira arboris TaxID=84035 RepID=A0A1H6V2E5_9FIRM|nr:hypothetical protein SAMN05660742_10280 [Propionispira arboris]